MRSLPSVILGPIERLAASLAALSGWRRYALAALLGIAAAIAMPPYFAFPILFLAFPGLIWLLNGAHRGRVAFWTTWWFGFGHFIIGNYWIANALLVEADRFAWMIPFAIGGLAAGMAVIPALAGYGTRKWLWGESYSAIVSFAALWALLESTRGWLLTGYPWNPIGLVATFTPELFQSVAYYGIWGLGLVIVLIASLPATLADSTLSFRRRWMGPFLSLALLTGLFAWGHYRLAYTDPDHDFHERVVLRLVQAGIDQKEKLRADQRLQNIDKHITLSRGDGFSDLTVVIWPETSIEYLLESSPDLLSYLRQAVPPGGLLLTGTMRGEPAFQKPEQVWNSLAAINGSGQIVGLYDKHHLVPFGEYTPFKTWLPFIDKVVPGMLDFSVGSGPKTLSLPGLPAFGPLICYEAIFPGEVIDRNSRPSWLLNITNDGWFGTSTGPHQHFAKARLRAVEEGIPLVRAANTGISAVIDAHGRIKAHLGLGEVGVIDSGLPLPLPEPTLYGRYGNIVFYLFAGLLLIGSLALKRLPPLKKGH